LSPRAPVFQATFIRLFGAGLPNEAKFLADLKVMRVVRILRVARVIRKTRASWKPLRRAPK
jgi:hypothetical protein